MLAAGTASYRAPELLSEDPKFTNRVDIWALGCILYEIVYHKRAFVGDWDVQAYKTMKSSSIISVPKDKFTPIFSSHLSGLLGELLSIEWQQRPRSQDLARMFKAYSQVFDPDLVTSIRNIPGFPGYQEWKNLLLTHRTEYELSNELDRRYKGAMRLGSAMIEKIDSKGLPLASLPHLDMCQSYLLKGQKEEAIRIWYELVRRYPKEIESLARLAKFYQEKEDYLAEVVVREELVRRHPDDSSILYLLGKAYERQGDSDAAIPVWKQLIVRGFPSMWESMYELATVHEIRGDHLSSIGIWTELVDMYPDHGGIRSGLREAYGKYGKHETSIDGWRRFMEKYPHQPAFVTEFMKVGAQESPNEYVVVRIADIGAFRSHKGYDIIPFNGRSVQAAHYVSSLLTKKWMTWTALYDHIASLKHLPFGSFRLWHLCARSNRTTAPLVPIEYSSSQSKHSFPRRLC